MFFFFCSFHASAFITVFIAAMTLLNVSISQVSNVSKLALSVRNVEDNSNRLDVERLLRSEEKEKKKALL